jgi:hypothetical protein
MKFAVDGKGSITVWIFVKNSNTFAFVNNLLENYR